MKIAIVGNADIHGYYGDDIDTHDTVIRFNHCRTKGYEDHVGTKTNILGVALGTNAGAGHLENIDKTILSQIDTVIFSKPKRNTMYEDRINQIAKKQVMYQYPDNKRYEDLVDIVGKNPSTGIVVIWHVLNTLGNVAEITCYNFDSFKTVHYWENKKREKKVLYHPVDNEKKLLNTWHKE